MRCLAFILSVFIFAQVADAASSMAFGYLTNNSENRNYDYLETIFPNSFANSIHKMFNVPVVKPNEINQTLKKHNLVLEKRYEPYALQELVEKIGTQYFIYGNFTPLPGDRIKIVMNLYVNGTNKLFSFTNVGKMETEIFNLVDRISAVLHNVLGDDNLYRIEVIQPGSKLAILCNLEGEELNSMYHSFMSKGYRLAGFGGNELHALIDDDDIERFKYMTAPNNSYDIVTDTRTFTFKFGSWAGEKYLDNISYIRNIYKVYDSDFFKTSYSVFEKLSSRYGGIDNILIVGFNSSRTSAWVRCFNMKDRDFVWMQSKIQGKSPSAITDALIDRMKSKLEVQ